MPDLLTTANLACGVLSALLAAQGETALACWLIFLAALFDVFDGLAARALGGGSELGRQMDSLADMVSFGVAPGVLIYYNVGLSLSALIFPQAAQEGAANLSAVHPAISWMLAPAFALALVIPVAAAWRLAKFNIDPRQSHGFLGLPSPANALFWAGLLLSLQNMGFVWFFVFANHWKLLTLAMAAAVVVLSALMLVELPLPSLKFSHAGWRGNEVIFVLLAAGVVLVALFGFLAVPLLLILYLFSPLWGKLFPKPK